MWITKSEHTGKRHICIVCVCWLDALVFYCCNLHLKSISIPEYLYSSFYSLSLTRYFSLLLVFFTSFFRRENIFFPTLFYRLFYLTFWVLLVAIFSLWLFISRSFFPFPLFCFLFHFHSFSCFSSLLLFSFIFSLFLPLSFNYLNSTFIFLVICFATLQDVCNHNSTQHPVLWSSK